jgi:HEAT repeat protein
MKPGTLASQIADLRRQFDAAGPVKKRTVASALWALCLESRAANRVASPWLRELAVSPDAKLVHYGTHALGRGGEQQRKMLRALLRHPRELVRNQAAYGLADGVDTSAATLDRLAAMLRSRSADERIAAISAMGRVSKFSERKGLLVKYRKQVLAVLDDKDSAVRSWAPDAVEGAFRSKAQFVQYALDRVDQPARTARHELVSSLAEALEDVDARPYLSKIRNIVRAQPRLVNWFLGPLSQAGPEAADLVPLLEPFAKGDSLEALRAGGALLRIAGRREVLGKLARQLPQAPDEVAGILCDIGPAAAPVAATLARVIDENFDEPDWDLMWALTDALAAIESPTPVAVRALRKSLSHESGRVKSSALQGLRKLGPAARAALPDLRSLAKEWRGESSRRVRQVISAIEAPAQ